MSNSPNLSSNCSSFFIKENGVVVGLLRMCKDQGLIFRTGPAIYQLATALCLFETGSCPEGHGKAQIQPPC